MRALLLMVFMFSLSCHAQDGSPKAPQVPAKQQPDSRAKGEAKSTEQDKSPAPIPTLVQLVKPPITEQERADETHKATHEATEFWTIFGRRLKITDTLLAVFTLALVIATLFLWRATKKLWQSAERIERPFIVEAYKPDGLMPKRMAINVYPDAPASYIPMIEYQIINCGKTPAVIISSFVDLQILGDLPPLPPYGVEKFFGESIVGADDSIPANFVTVGDGLSQQHYSAQDWADMRNGKKFFLFIGRIKYTSIYGTKHETRWAYRWAIEGFSARFVAVGGEAYNKRT